MGPLWRLYCVYMGVYMGQLLGPLVYLYIWAHYGGLLYIFYIWVWFFINKNMIKIEK